MFKLLAALAVVLMLAAPAAAQTPDPNRLFADSKIVVRDHFSDEVVGKGPDVVFIPGLASSRATWKATAERLRGHYRLHLIQIAGFAGEPARANAAGDVLVPTAEAIDAYLVQEKLTPAVLIGHSLGGTTILYLAEKHPEHLKKAMMVDAIPFMGVLFGAKDADAVRPMAAQTRDMMAKGGPGYASGLTPMVKGMVSREPDQQTVIGWGLASDPSVVGRAAYDDFTLDLRPDLAGLKTRLTLLYPDNKPSGAPTAAVDAQYQAAYAAAPVVKLVRIDDAKHFIMLDQPQAFAAALDAFLAQP
ncbi:alpha/beta hydrolase [Phenylobacterium sp.]|uniref:alpha/beta hydrolase n=1 Tax=Phenylobacterium sp. TaxID=1871053 RepID=UPI0035649321